MLDKNLSWFGRYLAIKSSQPGFRKMISFRIRLPTQFFGKNMSASMSLGFQYDNCFKWFVWEYVRSYRIVCGGCPSGSNYLDPLLVRVTRCVERECLMDNAATLVRVIYGMTGQHSFFKMIVVVPIHHLRLVLSCSFLISRTKKWIMARSVEGRRKLHKKLLAW